MELFGSNFNLFHKREVSLSPADQAKAGIPVTTDPNHPSNQQQKQQDGGGSFEERIQWQGKTYQILAETFNADRQGNTIQFLCQQIVNDK